MSYQNFQVPKTICLPISENDNLTFEGYKEKYGIDLLSIMDVVIDEGGDGLIIDVTLPLLTEIKIVSVDGLFCSAMQRIIYCEGTTVDSEYEEGSSDGITKLGAYCGDEGAMFGIRLILPKESDPEINNIKLSMITA